MALPDAFASKVPLRMDESGRFRILMLSDMHYAPDRDARTLRLIEELLDETKPQFVMLGGDNTTGKSTMEEFELLLNDIASPIERRGLPWAHVFGNHDISPDLSKPDQMRVYERYPHCVSKAGPKDIPGTGNYFLPILDAGGQPVFGLWALDSHQDFETPSEKRDLGFEPYWELLLPKRLHAGSDWEFIRFEQIMWYWNSSVEIEQSLGRKLPSIMFFHIPLYEFNAPLMNAERCGLIGEYNEAVSCSELNSGMFAAALQRGDVKGIFCGHDHINTFDATYCGIRLGYDGSAGCHAYGVRAFDPKGDRERLRGGRVFDIDASHPWQFDTHMVFGRNFT